MRGEALKRITSLQMGNSLILKEALDLYLITSTFISNLALLFFYLMPSTFILKIKTV